MVKFTSVEVVNGVLAFAELYNDFALIEEAFFLSNEEEVAGWLLYESEQWSKPLMGDSEYFSSMWENQDILVQAHWIKKGIQKYDLRKV
mgnify:FL=1